jgi:hypothetical protein
MPPSYQGIALPALYQGIALAGYQGIALAMPQAVPPRCPFRGWARAYFDELDAIFLTIASTSFRSLSFRLVEYRRI